MTKEALLQIDHLSVAFPSRGRNYRAVDDVSLEIHQGEIFALVGESGCGKSTVASALVNLVPAPGFVEKGAIWLKGRDLLRLPRSEYQKLRGGTVSTILQGAMNSFNPVSRIGRQFEDLMEAHPGRLPARTAAWAHFRDLLERVHLDPETVPRAYPHELSGGMKQRLAIAMGLVLNPSLLILDEPTTALDVVNQRTILDIVRGIHDETGITVLFITHDLGIVAALAHRVGVMYAGQLVDHGTVEQVFYDNYRHPYVSALLRAVPSILLKREHARPIPGSVPDIGDLPTGCRFSNRCQLTESGCREGIPPLIPNSDGHAVRCLVIQRAK